MTALLVLFICICRQCRSY